VLVIISPRWNQDCALQHEVSQSSFVAKCGKSVH
jgi:hypothetical protein